ncbi:hypothetical protein MDA_GLEAN10008560 [Myotis davidii]|uniref:Uncharacterized protein n=1 Tax=Myotis davidii TaxID=225400 RepID=L5LTZ5_MYODS|nr:hypothetical protein MDA_GLEAN10008560 [Myotis davidii]
MSDCRFSPDPCGTNRQLGVPRGVPDCKRVQAGLRNPFLPPCKSFVHQDSSSIIFNYKSTRGPVHEIRALGTLHGSPPESSGTGTGLYPMVHCMCSTLSFASPLGLKGPIPGGLGLSWQSDIPLAAQQPSVDVHLPVGSRPKLQSDILSAAEEAGEAPTTTAVLAAISLACAGAELPLWERTDHEGTAPALSICPLVVSVCHSDQSFPVVLLLGPTLYPLSQTSQGINDERESWIGCHLHALHWGLSLQPGHVLLTSIEPGTLQSTG